MSASNIAFNRAHVSGVDSGISSADMSRPTEIRSLHDRGQGIRSNMSIRSVHCLLCWCVGEVCYWSFGIRAHANVYIHISNAHPCTQDLTSCFSRTPIQSQEILASNFTAGR